ncbi:microcystin-dependent protein [Dyadobacter jejuensis]|uniref:Microcystin-dependent protein n=1 Tax=Dyadobacter jejuensis TaxID=1082580 RepID=A0A316B655_9BACT|nr:tail fiber protein [Dyadobacter jejuensis]PWJ58077.1 microcystin-dependent protein [Dyadobacter jejuensis]
MAEPFLSEIRMVSFTFPPKGWALANGQLLPINQNQALYSLLGTTFGGDGRVNFALPDYQGRVPMHVSQGHRLGEKGGEQSHTLSVSELPSHTHLMSAIDPGSSDNNINNPSNSLFSNSKPADLYQNTLANLTALSPNTIGGGGGNQSHINMQPFLTISFCIALQGVFPTRN